MEKLIVHNGTFHTDDVALTSFVRMSYPNISVERRMPTEDELDDPNIIVGDVGLRYDISNNNFDHHQDKELPCAVVLYLTWYWDEYFDSIDEFSLFKEVFLTSISLVDTTGMKIESNVPNLISTINGFNLIDDGFDKAVDFMTLAIESTIAYVKQRLYTETRWFKLKTYNNIIKINDTSENLSDWRVLAVRDEILCYVVPSNRNEGKYNIISRNTDEYVLPEHELLTFRHSSGFLAEINSDDLYEYLDFIISNTL